MFPVENRVVYKIHEHIKTLNKIIVVITEKTDEEYERFFTASFSFSTFSLSVLLNSSEITSHETQDALFCIQSY